ncbi:MAG: hypothetical protein PF574_04815 [Candidatus Delongbacteria bacterium]|nr:hypothetical protein [Candidatus Delongbacteria bacterium]
MLAAALHLYFETWIKQSRCPVDESLKKSVFKKKGWLSGYKAHFTQQFIIEFDATPINYSLLEEVILARNCIQHPHSITSPKTQYAKSDLKKIRHPFFVDDRETTLSLDVTENDRAWFFPPTLHVTNDQLIAAISEVERFANWFEVEIEKKVYERYTSNT